MASGPTLPPQAYTREILTAAFNWLQTQPESVKKLAVTPDALVGLYMRAQRYGHSSLEADAPVSAQNFMSDLKHLAESFKQFEGPSSQSMAKQRSAPMGNVNSGAYTNNSSAHTHDSSSFAAAQNHFSNQNFMSQNLGAPSGGQSGGIGQYPSQLTNHQSAVQAPILPPNRQNQVAYSEESVFSGLNPRAQQMIQEVKERLNLSTDAEAINMMVALAYKNLKDLLA